MFHESTIARAESYSRNLEPPMYCLLPEYSHNHLVIVEANYYVPNPWVGGKLIDIYNTRKRAYIAVPDVRIC